MKRVFILLVLPVLLLRLPAMAQDTATTPLDGAPAAAPANPPAATTAAAIAAREAAEERYKRMAADLQAVQSDNEALRAKIAAMEQEIQTLRDAVSKPVDNSSMQEALKSLADKIQEVDKKRLEDKDAISDEIRNSMAALEASLRGAPPPVTAPINPPRTRSAPSTSQDPAPPVKGYSYTIQSGDTLGEIVKAYNADFKIHGKKTITLRQAMAANPNVNWGRLLVGQKIIIPMPESK